MSELEARGIVPFGRIISKEISIHVLSRVVVYLECICPRYYLVDITDLHDYRVKLKRVSLVSTIDTAASIREVLTLQNKLDIQYYTCLSHWLVSLSLTGLRNMSDGDMVIHVNTGKSCLEFLDFTLNSGTEYSEYLGLFCDEVFVVRLEDIVERLEKVLSYRQQIKELRSSLVN
jgi:hypothetical protein